MEGSSWTTETTMVALLEVLYALLSSKLVRQQIRPAASSDKQEIAINRRAQLRALRPSTSLYRLESVPTRYGSSEVDLDLQGHLSGPERTPPGKNHRLLLKRVVACSYSEARNNSHKSRIHLCEAHSWNRLVYVYVPDAAASLQQVGCELVDPQPIIFRVRAFRISFKAQQLEWLMRP